jgi:putative cardiolipin synthase
MHNKDFIVDGEVAIIGGRNIGDEYFDAKNDGNFRDLDVIAIGPVVAAASTTFETYWTSEDSHPLSEFKFHEGSTEPARGTPDQERDPDRPHVVAEPKASVDPAKERLILEKNARSFQQSAYQETAANDLPKGASADLPGNWFWGPASLVADSPEKIEAGTDRSDLRITPQLNGMIRQAQSEVLIVSPYFIPSEKDDENFVAAALRGVAFKVLTNSLASTDELAVYGSYAEHRRKLLQGGVELYELKQMPGVETSATDAGRSSGVSLHAKAIVVDHRYVFIGSLNMDRRSKLLNTEMGVVVDSPLLAKAVEEFFATATSPANAYHLTLGGKGGEGMHWEYIENGKPVETDHEPNASLLRHAKVLLMKLLPIDSLL